MPDSITRHYDSLTDKEIAEDRAWAEFATQQFVAHWDANYVIPDVFMGDEGDWS